MKRICKMKNSYSQLIKVNFFIYSTYYWNFLLYQLLSFFKNIAHVSLMQSIYAKEGFLSNISIPHSSNQLFPDFSIWKQQNHELCGAAEPGIACVVIITLKSDSNLLEYRGIKKYCSFVIDADEGGVGKEPESSKAGDGTVRDVLRGPRHRHLHRQGLAVPLSVRLFHPQRALLEHLLVSSVGIDFLKFLVSQRQKTKWRLRRLINCFKLCLSALLNQF